MKLIPVHIPGKSSHYLPIAIIRRLRTDFQTYGRKMTGSLIHDYPSFSLKTNFSSLRIRLRKHLFYGIGYHPEDIIDALEKDELRKHLFYGIGYHGSIRLTPPMVSKSLS